MRTHSVSLPIPNRAAKAGSSGSEKPGFWAIKLGGWRHMPTAQRRRLQTLLTLPPGGCRNSPFNSVLPHSSLFSLDTLISSRGSLPLFPSSHTAMSPNKALALLDWFETPCLMWIYILSDLPLHLAASPSRLFLELVKWSRGVLQSLYIFPHCYLIFMVIV